MKSSASPVLIFLTFFALGIVAFLVFPHQAAQKTPTVQAGNNVEVNWGEGTEADLSKSAPATSR